MTLRLQPDDPLLAQLFTPAERKAMAKVHGKKRPKVLGEKSAEEILYEGLARRFLVVGCQLQFTFHATRKWRWDFAWPQLKVALEYDGLILPSKPDANGRVLVRGGHATVTGIRKSHEKGNAAAIDGWLVLRCEADALRSGRIYTDVERCLRARGYYA